MGEGYLQVMKTENIGLQSQVLIEKLLISLLDTMPNESLTLGVNLYLEIALLVVGIELLGCGSPVLFFW